MNLSFLEASVAAMLRHSPDKGDGGNEVALLLNAPAVPKQGSGKSEGVRWACGLIKNLAKAEDNAGLFGWTDVPKCVVGNLRNTAAPLGRWTSNSLEDFSLFVTTWSSAPRPGRRWWRPMAAAGGPLWTLYSVDVSISFVIFIQSHVYLPTSDFALLLSPGR